MKKIIFAALLLIAIGFGCDSPRRITDTNTMSDTSNMRTDTRDTSNMMQPDSLKRDTMNRR